MKYARMLANNLVNILDVLPSDINNVIEHCGNILVKGGVISLPTDTIYGIACLAQNEEAVAKLYQIKKRNLIKPIAICVANLEEAYKFGDIIINKSLLKELLPGPYTLIFHRTKCLNNKLNPNYNNIGIRIPKFSFINQLAKHLISYGPLALTSANLSDEPNSTKIEDFCDIWNCLDFIIDSGELNSSGLGSTILDFSKGNVTIIRKGSGFNECIDLLKKYGYQPS